MKAIILDTETTGLDFKSDRILEIGFRMVDNELACGLGHSILIMDGSYPPITEEITKLTGISNETMAQAMTPDNAFRKLSNEVMAEMPDVVIAYNADFDKAMFTAEVNRGAFTMYAGINHLMQIPWVCAMKDLESNYAYKCKKLSHLALDYGIPVDPSKLHRALADVDLTLSIMMASKTTIQQLHDFHKVPWIYVAALTRPPWEDNGKSTASAKKRGYNWQEVWGDNSGRKFDKAWVKMIKEHNFEKEQKEAPFQVSLIK